jgi:serine phosphatase RsbU (regulator of sigma subunit)
MESTTMKTLSSTAAPVSSGLLVDTAAALGAAKEIPVAQALAAIGDPDTTAELAQRLVATVTMLWSDVLAADLFVPQPGSGELRGVRDVSSGVALLSAVASPYGDEAAVRVIPVTPSLFGADSSSVRGSCISTPVVGERGDGAADAIEGFIIVQRRPSAPDFTTRDLDALSVLGKRAGELMQRMRVRGGRSVAAWFQRDMASAREMQRMFLPQSLQSSSAHVRVLAEYQPAFDVGGDFYDFVDLGDGRLLAAIGDVSGKGVTAALMMSRISSELHRLAADTTGPAEMLHRLNRSMPGVMQDDRFVTVVCVLLDIPNRRWVVSNAGHVVPILRRRSGAVAGLAYSSGPPIGMLANATYEDEVFPLESRDILVLATDGVFEMLAGPRRPCSTMGQCKLTEVVQKAPHDLAEIHRRILSAVESTSIGRDDVALLGLELTE